MPTAAEMVQFYVEAEIKVLTGQTVEIEGKRLTLANLEEIRRGRAEWERRAVLEALGVSPSSTGPAVARWVGDG